VSAEKSLFEEVKEQTIKNPKDADAWYHLASLYENAQMHQEEMAALQKVIEIDPGRGYAYVKLGNAYNRLGRHQDAVTSFRTALKYFPKDPVQPLCPMANSARQMRKSPFLKKQFPCDPTMPLPGTISG
jgi:tetratricopeptide (TPR) repeat protein